MPQDEEILGVETATQEQDQIDPYSMFNDPVNLDAFDDEEEIPITGNPWGVDASESTEDPEPEKPLFQNEEPSKEVALNFEDEVIKEQKDSAESKTDAELIAELEKRGITVAKPKEEDVNAQRTEELQRLNSTITSAESFLNLPPEKIVREKLRSNLVKQYTSSGRQSQIESDDFQIDLESELEKYTENSTLLNIYSDNIKREVQDVIRETKEKAGEINSVVEKEIKQTLVQKREKLQSGVTAIHASGIFGIRPTAKESEEIYDSIISGEFTKSVNSDPNLVAEFATFIKFREKINSKLGGPTYGEGVKSAAETINGGPLKTESSLGTVVRNATQGVTGSGNNNDRRKSWEQKTVELPKTSESSNVVAGAGSSFL